MSDKRELKFDYYDDKRDLVDVMEGLVETDFAAHEEICGEEDDNIVIQEEVVINNANNSSIGNDFEEEDIEFEEENEANDGDDEELNETSDGNDVLSADDQNSALMAEESINADNDSNNDLVIDQISPEDNNPEDLTVDEKVGENEVYQWSAFPLHVPRKAFSFSATTTPMETENEAINGVIKVKVEPKVAANGGEQSGAHNTESPDILPNRECSRCKCEYDLDCNNELYKEFFTSLCPKCLTEHIQKSKEPKVNGQTNGIDSDMDSVPQLMPKAAQPLFVSTTPLLIQQPLVKSRSNFAPILPKPPQLQQSGLYHQKQLIYQKNRHKFQSPPVQPLATHNKSAAKNTRLTAGTHLCRAATGPNGHPVIIKDKSRTKSSARKRSDIKTKQINRAVSARLSSSMRRTSLLKSKKARVTIEVRLNRSAKLRIQAGSDGQHISSRRQKKPFL